MRPPRRVLLLCASLVVAPASNAAAFSFGITGYSGKQGGRICNDCHTVSPGPAQAPTVVISGPSEMLPGAIATFRITITSARTAQGGAGFNVAASAGNLEVVTTADTQKGGTELTHKQTKNNVNRVAFWDFTWQAPETPGTHLLFGAGNSVNRNGASSGDRAADDILEVAVAAAATPTASATPVPPTPTMTPTSASTHTATALPTSAPTHTATASPTPLAPCFGDCDGDRTLTAADLELFRAALLLCEPCPGAAVAAPAAGCAAAPAGCLAADFDADGCLGAGELTRLIAAAEADLPCP